MYPRATWTFECGGSRGSVSSKLGRMKGSLFLWKVALGTKWEHGDLVMTRAGVQVGVAGTGRDGPSPRTESHQHRLIAEM